MIKKDVFENTTVLDKIDKNIAVEATIFNERMKIYDVTKEPFSIYGNSKTGENVFLRMDEKVAENVSPEVSVRGRRAAGIRICFKTDSKKFGIRTALSTPIHPASSTAISTSGFDVYVGNRFVGSICPEITEVKSEVLYEQIIDMEDGMKDITVYCPYNGIVNKLLFALQDDANVQPVKKYKDMPPIIFYGSSITHGFFVSRPGNTFTAKISRNLNMDYINLGFSGAARGESTMAEYIASLEKSVIVCEYDHNEPNPEELKKRHLPFYKKIRETDSKTPILFISRPDTPEINEDYARKKVVEATYNYAVENGDKNVYFIDGHTLYSDEFRYDCSIDGVHPNDLGAHMIAKKISEHLKKFYKCNRLKFPERMKINYIKLSLGTPVKS